MTLYKAVAVVFPQGSLTLSSLRTAIKDGDLAARTVAGKMLTTPRAIREMTTPFRAAKPSRPASGSGSAPAANLSGSSSTEALRSAQNAGLTTMAALRVSLRPTSGASTSRRRHAFSRRARCRRCPEILRPGRASGGGGQRRRRHPVRRDARLRGEAAGVLGRQTGCRDQGRVLPRLRHVADEPASESCTEGACEGKARQRSD